jgi:hypothetical protein
MLLRLYMMLRLLLRRNTWPWLLLRLCVPFFLLPFPFGCIKTDPPSEVLHGWAGWTTSLAAKK